VYLIKSFVITQYKAFENANEHGLCLNRQQKENASSLHKDDKSIHFPVYDFDFFSS
jgi:hypothetical protein